MNLKTDTPEFNSTKQPLGFSSDFIIGLVMLTGATLLYFFFANKWPSHFEFKSPDIFYMPWLTATGITLTNGLNEFSNKTLEIVPLSQRLYTLINILLLYIIAPTLFFCGWKMRYVEKISKNRFNIFRVATMLFVLGGFFVLGIAIHSIPKVYFLIKSNHEHRNNSIVLSNKDSVENDLHEIAWHAYQYKVLPHKLGGGSGSYTGFILPVELSKTEYATYTVAATDSTVVLTGRSSIYSDASIKIGLDKHGKMNDWQYSGKFEY
jgi:hypothetical protein